MLLSASVTGWGKLLPVGCIDNLTISWGCIQQKLHNCYFHGKKYTAKVAAKLHFSLVKGFILIYCSIYST